MKPDTTIIRPFYGYMDIYEVIPPKYSNYIITGVDTSLHNGVKHYNIHLTAPVKFASDTIMPCNSNYLLAGDNRSASEIIGTIQREPSKPIQVYNYDPYFMLAAMFWLTYTTALCITRNLPFWIGIIRRKKMMINSKNG